MPSLTIRDVARRAGVGVGTVSRVLNDSGAVSEATRQRVLSVIEELDYVPHFTARRLSTGKTLTIGVILPFFTFPSYVERLRGVESVLGTTEYDLVLFNVESPDRRDAIFSDLSRRKRVDGLIIMSLLPDDNVVQRFTKSGLPVVLVDARHNELSSVFVDDVYGGYLATRHLIELGHRRIGIISDYLENAMGFVSMERRFVGYYQALEEAEIDFRPLYHRQEHPRRATTSQLAHDFFDLPEPPTAIFAFSDMQAIGVIEAAKTRGLDIPGDITVVGYDDINAASFLHLTTIRQPLFESGMIGAQLLLEQLGNGKTDNAVEIVQLPVELVTRETSGPPESRS